MKISRRKDIESLVLDDLRAYYVNQNKKRTGIHLSDLISPRKAYWNTLKPLPPTDEEIQYFLIGRGHEESLHACSGYDHGEEKEWNGILYTPDFYYNFPDESKTRRGNLAKPGEEENKYDYYIQQVLGYCAVSNVNQGWLRVWSLMERQEDKSTKPEFAAYQIEFTDVELINERERLLNMRSCLVESLRQNNHKLLPQCAQWQCGKVSRTIKKSAYCEDCKKEFVQYERHLKSKPDHKIVMPEYNYAYEKRCKYFDVCEPVLT